MACTHTTKCELYVQFAADPSIQLWKNHYCAGEFKRCARYVMSLTGATVPLSLLPNGKSITLEMTEEDRAMHALFNAIQKNRLPMVKAFLKTKTTNSKVATSEGITPVMYAASLGHTEIMQFFLEHGCNPHHRSKKGETALELAARAGHNNCVELLKIAMKRIAPSTESQLPMPTEESSSRSSLMGRVLGFLRGSKPEAA